MEVKKCCCCIELRIGCIIIAVVGITLGIIGVALSPGWGSALSLILGIAANCCLLYSAAYNKGSTESRSLTALIFIGCVVLSMIFQIIWLILQIIVLAKADGFSSTFLPFTISWLTTSGIRFLLSLYFCLVAYSFYKELSYKTVPTKNVDQYKVPA